MLRKFGSISVALLACLFCAPWACAQVDSGIHSRPRITESVDDATRVSLAGNVRPEARLEFDRGRVLDSHPMEHLLLQLKRSPEQEKALEQFIDELHTQGSPNFHHWLPAQEFGERFGLAQPDIDAVTSWLQSHGFKVNVVYPSGMLIDFSGTAGQVGQAFGTEIHHLAVKGERHIANMTDPRIPAALAPVVAGIVSLHDFRPHAMVQLRKANPEFTFIDALGNTNYAVVPADLATIYNLNPLFSSGVSGQGQTIALIEDTDVFTANDWNTFRSTFGLSGYTAASFSSVHPAPSSGANNCAAPGVISPNDAEAILDAEWASASAPSAAILMASCADTSTTFGGLIAVQNLINAATPPSILSISYGQCETVNGAAANASYNSAYQQAAAEGVSVFVAAGDSGAAGCDNSVAEATHGIGVNAFASTPYNVAVGGTDFSDTYFSTNANYWNSSNTPAFGSALSYIPEIPWNDSCAGLLLSNYLGYSPTYGSLSLCNDPLFGSFFMTTVAGGGGPSQCATGSPSTAGVVSGTCAGWAKPAWQSVLGNPNDGVRDTPDVSLFAADGLWSHFYIFCWSNTAKGGATCGSDPSVWSGAGGTSFASPIMAGIQALINQKAGGPQGNPAPVYYQLAAAEYGASGNASCNSSNGAGVASRCIFYDVTLGDMDVDCAGPNCYLADGSVGVLSTSNTAFLPAYGTNIGWDFATGIGTVNAANLVNNWNTKGKPNPPALSIAKTHSGNFTQGQANATYSVSVSNAANAGATSGSVTVTETLPSGLTLVSMSGAGWTCAANACTRSDALGGGASYPAVTVTVNVAANATSPQVNQVVVSGGGSANANASDTAAVATSGGGAGGATASFLKADTTTEGSWHGTYGGDGYSTVNDSQSIPSYASFTVTNAQTWTWVASTTDPRALQTGSGSSRIAATWYGKSPFTFDVNLTDGKVHQFALYAVDWDFNGRTETIQVLDANSNNVLDTRNLSNFGNGAYLVWNLSGHVKINVIFNSGLNAVVSGVFFGPGGNVTESVVVSPQNVNLAEGQQQQFTADVIGVPNQAVTWSIASVSPASAASGSISSSGLYTAPATPAAQVVVKATSADGTASGTATVNLLAAPMATFVRADTKTQGSWHGTYGADGHSIANDSQSIPSYASFAVNNAPTWTWVASTSDPRALQTGSGSGRIAATWYGSSPFTFDVNLLDGNTHQLALYAVDWDNSGRTETVQILDAVNNNVLDTRALSNFANGTYLVWSLSGHVKINVVWNAGVNAVVSGVFFGANPPNSESVSVSPQSFNLGAVQQQQFAATVGGTANQAVTWSIASVNPAGAASGSISATGLYTAPATISPAQVIVKATSADGTAYGTATVNLVLGPVVNLLGADTTTQGTWHGVYGIDGYSIINDSQSIPSYALFTVTNAQTWTWVASTTDPRALQTGSGSSRIAATWYGNSLFTFDVNLTDGKVHQLELYAVDWDLNSRTETIQVLDASSNSVLATGSLSNFGNGVYMLWSLSGHVKINVIFNSGVNAVVSGVFFK